MDKLKMHSPNLVRENITRVRELFPGCVTEAHDENGNPKLLVDFDQLRQELSESIVEGPQERYHLNWPGKREALLTANAPIAKTLRPFREESVDFDTTKNLFIKETIQSKTVFFVDENALVACFDTGVDEELVKQLAGFEPLRVVFRDNGFVSDAVKINVEQIFKQMSPGTEVKAI